MEIGGKDLVFLIPTYEVESLIKITKEFFNEIWEEVVFEWDESLKVLDIHKNQKVFENWESDPTGYISLWLNGKDSFTFVIEPDEETENMVNKLAKEIYFKSPS